MNEANYKAFPCKVMESGKSERAISVMLLIDCNHESFWFELDAMVTEVWQIFFCDCKRDDLIVYVTIND